MHPYYEQIDTDAFSALVCELASDGLPNDQIAELLAVRVGKVESAVQEIRRRGHKLDRPAMNMARMHRLFGIGSVVSANLRRMTAFYEDIDHPKAGIVAARRIGVEIGRSEEWVKTIAEWHRKALALARIELGGVDNALGELQLAGPASEEVMTKGQKAL